jgi:hypothetical protein
MEAAVFKERLNKLDTTDLEEIPEEKETLAEQQEVPNGEAGVGTVGALEDRYGVWFLGVGRRQQVKIGTQGDGGSRKKLFTARGRLTHRAISAMHKERIHKGPGKTASNGIRGRSGRLELHLCSKKIF